MINRNKKILLFICLLFLISNFSLAMAKDVEFSPQIKIPGQKIDGVDIEPGQKFEVKGRTFIDYMIAIYKWSVTAIAIIAVIMIMIAGFQWMTAAGNASAIGQARSRISSSLIGLLLAVGAYSLLNFINPSLVHLRSLDLEDIKYVKLNIANKVCTDDGLTAYEWSNHHCFNIEHNGGSTHFFPSSDFSTTDDIGNFFKFDKIIIDLGLDENYISNCDFRNDFKAISSKQQNVTLDIDSNPAVLIESNHMFQWIINLYGLGDFTYEQLQDDFYGTINDSSAGIMVIAEFDTDDNLTGINVEVVNKTAGKASAYISNIKIITDIPCLICCKSDDVLLYDYDVECNWGSKVSLTECDNEHCAHYRDSPDDCYTANGGGGLMEEMCKGVSARCDGACQWAKDVSGEFYRCYGT